MLAAMHRAYRPCVKRGDFTSSTLSMCATTESPDTITVCSSMLMISPIFLTGRRMSFASAVPEQKKFMTPSGSAARRECPGSSRRLNRAVATVFATLQLQQFSARLPSRERQLGDVGGDAPGLVAGEQLRRRASGLGTALEIDVGERLTVGVRATKMRLGLPARAAFY